MSGASSVPAAIDALVTAIRASSELAGVQIEDGPQVVAVGPSDVLSVGFVSEDGSAAVEASAVNEGMGINRLRESMSINCAAAVVNGDGDISTARRRAYALMTAVGGVLEADKTLGGTVMSSAIGAHSLTQDQTAEAGAIATLVFAVVCDAYSPR